MADYQPLVARGLVGALADDPEVDVYEGSGEPSALVREVLDWGPDLVLLGMPRNPAAALNAAAELSRERPTTRLIVVAETDRDIDVVNMVKVGVTGVLSRSASVADVLATVRQGLVGRSTLSGEVANRLLAQVATATTRMDPRTAASGLTARELEVLRLVADGLHNRDVANRLHISENTVKNHMRSVHEKLGVRTRTEAVVTAAREGLLGLG